MKSRNTLIAVSALLLSLFLVAATTRTFGQSFVSASDLSSDNLFPDEMVFFDFWNPLIWHIANHDDLFLKEMQLDSNWLDFVPSHVYWGLKALSGCALAEPDGKKAKTCKRSSIATLAYGLSYIYSGYSHMIWDSSVGTVSRTMGAANYLVNPFILVAALATSVVTISIDRAYLEFKEATKGDNKRIMTGFGDFLLSKLPKSLHRRGTRVINGAILSKVSDMLPQVAAAAWFVPVSTMTIAGAAGVGATGVAAKSTWDVYTSLSLYYFLVRQFTNPGYEASTIESYRFSGMQKNEILNAFSHNLNKNLFDRILQAKLKVAKIPHVSDPAINDQAEHLLSNVNFSNTYSLAEEVFCGDSSSFSCRSFLSNLHDNAIFDEGKCVKVVLSRQSLVNQFGNKGYVLDLCRLSKYVVTKLPGGKTWVVHDDHRIHLYHQLIDILQPVRVMTYIEES